MNLKGLVSLVSVAAGITQHVEEIYGAHKAGASLRDREDLNFQKQNAATDAGMDVLALIEGRPITPELRPLVTEVIEVGLEQAKLAARMKALEQQIRLALAPPAPATSASVSSTPATL